MKIEECKINMQVKSLVNELDYTYRILKVHKKTVDTLTLGVHGIIHKGIDPSFLVISPTPEEVFRDLLATIIEQTDVFAKTMLNKTESEEWLMLTTLQRQAIQYQKYFEDKQKDE